MQNVAPKRAWFFIILALCIVGILSFGFAYAFDVSRAGGSDPIGSYWKLDPQTITDAIPALAAMMAAVFGIVVTVVSIIVQLSADRFTGVAQMFLRDRINIGVMMYFVLICVSGIWLSLSIKSGFVPVVAIGGMIIATTLGLVITLPYFAYVFWFLEPKSIITRIRRRAVRTIYQAIGRRDVTSSQLAVVSSMEELADIASNSISGKDKIIASAAVDAVRDLVLRYIQAKPSVNEEWFAISEGLEKNPDFVAMDPESLDDLVDRKTWLEWKALRTYLGIFRESMAIMPDINYLIAIDTRYIGEKAVRTKDVELGRLVLRYLNSYLRITINQGDVRVAYNVLNQYRILIESMIAEDACELATEAVEHMKYYGHVSYDRRITFITETVAYDVSALCAYAHEHKAACEDTFLELLLDLDRPLAEATQEMGLLGVRKAQVKIAAYYLANGEVDKAQRIAKDMSHEPTQRLDTIRRQLERVESKDFWEIIDRGRNFEYMPEEHRAKMPEFFEWVR